MRSIFFTQWPTCADTSIEIVLPYGSIPWPEIMLKVDCFIFFFLGGGVLCDTCVAERENLLLCDVQKSSSRVVIEWMIGKGTKRGNGVNIRDENVERFALICTWFHKKSKIKWPVLGIGVFALEFQLRYFQHKHCTTFDNLLNISRHYQIKWIVICRKPVK